MSILLDIIVIAIVAIIAYATMKRGFVKSFLNLVGLILAILIISSCGRMISNTIYTAFFDAPIVKSVQSNIEQSEEKSSAAATDVWNNLPKVVKNAANNSGVTSEKVGKIMQAGESAEASAKKISNDIIKPVAVSLLVIIVDIILFTLLMIVFRFLNRLICTLFKAPVLNQVNKLFGFLLGVVKGFIIAALVCSLITFLVSVSPKNEFLIFNEKVIENSYLFSKLSDILKLQSLF